MENRTTFNLKKIVQDWRSSLSANANMTTDNIDELESHLWDEMTELQNNNLSEEEAFIIAKKRIGSIDNITNEFSKVNRSLHFSNRILPYLRGILTYIAVVGIINFFVYAIIIITRAHSSFHEMITVNPYKFGVFLTSVLGIFALAYICFQQNIPVLKKFTEVPILVVSIVVCRTLQFIMFPQMILILSNNKFSELSVSLQIFSSYVLLVLVVVALLVHFVSKRKRKLIISS